jgi:hypothetical protein
MTFALQREIRRLGIDVPEFGALAIAKGVSTDDLLAWLRRLPTGLGPEAFADRLRSDGPVPGEATEKGIPPADPSFRDAEIDDLEAFFVELDRVCPLELRPDEFGLDFSCSYGEAAAILRRLPDRAGSLAAAEALMRDSRQR